MTQPMLNSYGRKRGDITGARFCGRVDIFRAGKWSEVRWTGFTATGDARELAAKVADEIGGEIAPTLLIDRDGYIHEATPTSQIVFVRDSDGRA